MANSSFRTKPVALPYQPRSPVSDTLSNLDKKSSLQKLSFWFWFGAWLDVNLCSLKFRVLNISDMVKIIGVYYIGHTNLPSDTLQSNVLRIHVHAEMAVSDDGQLFVFVQIWLNYYVCMPNTVIIQPLLMTTKTYPRSNCDVYSFLIYKFYIF